MAFNGLGMHLGNLSLLSDARSRSISGENPTGERGRGGMATEGPAAHLARDLGQGWKVSPFVVVPPHSRHTLADIEGPGAVQSMWFGRVVSRDAILRIHWDGQQQPSVECPVGDFFAVGWGEHVTVTSMPVVVAPDQGLNCFWEMPFRQRALITLENRSDTEMRVYYQINYTLTAVGDEAAYFHAQFRRTNPVPYREVHTIVDGVQGRGHYVGTYLAVGLNGANRWWGEGEVKFYLDGDEWPTICGTGTEDYFGGAYGWEVDRRYETYSTPFLGMHQVIQPDGLYLSQQRFGMYRWHVMDPVRFESNLRVSIQDLGWRGDPASDSRYLARQDDIASVALWYQALPTAAFPPLGSRDALEVI